LKIPADLVKTGPMIVNKPLKLRDYIGFFLKQLRTRYGHR
jgi:hypothetical protein